ncbi:major facilitator superfamily domain-containing protein [Ditylenchus destructor]|nr:major facilitator superfamily domain-containing protein [Ditylenchus destructor]
MVEEDEWNVDFNSTHKRGSNPYSYVEIPSYRNALFAASAIGSLLGAVPLGALSTKFSLRLLFTIYGLLSTLSMLCTPLAAFYGFWPLFVMRLFQGAGVAMFYFAISAINSAWAPLASSATMMNLISTNNQLGVILIMPLAGNFCETSLGWPAVFYFQGVFSLACFVMFYLFFTDCPRIHKCISEKELKMIEEGKFDNSGKTPQTVPYKAMLTDSVVWAAMIALFCDAIGFQVFTQVKFFTSVCELGMAFCFFALAILQSIPNCPAWIMQIFFTASTPFSGMNFLGVVKSAQLISGKYSPVLMAWYTLIDGGTVLILPLLVNFIAPEGTLVQWGRIFVVFGVIEVLAVILFDVIGSGEPSSWAKPDIFIDEKKDAKHDLKLQRCLK